MAKNGTPNELYWKHLDDQRIKDEYAKFLQAEGLENNPGSGHIFAMRKAKDGYRDKSERDLILLVSGGLPDVYD